MTDILTRAGQPDIAFIRTPAGISAETKGQDLPTVMFLGGFRSDMTGTKATYFEAQCAARGQAYIRFDYRGHGASGGKFEDACISDWLSDSMAVLDQCTSGPVILVGSSMGGWLSLLLARVRPARLQALIGLAAAPDFTTWIENEMNDQQRQEIAEKGFFALLNDYDDTPYIITKKLLEDGRDNALLDKKIDISMPVRLVQGKKDADVPWQVAEQIKQAITGQDVTVILLEEADHRLSSPEQLDLIDSQIQKLSGL